MEKLPNSNSKPSSREVSTQELPMEDSMPTHKSAKENTTDNASKTGLKRKEVLRRMMKVAHPETGRILIGLSALIVNAITNLSFPNIMRQAVDQAAADTAVSDSVATVVSSWGSVGMFVMNNYFVVKAAGIFFIGSVASWIRVYYLGSAKERITGSLRKSLFESYMDKDKEFYDGCAKGDLVVALDKDCSTAADLVTDVVAAGLRSFNSAINGSIMLYLSCPSLFGVTIGILPVVAISGMHMSKFSRSVANALRKKQAELMSFAVERLDCISTVMLNGKEQEEKENYRRQTIECQTLLNSAQLANGAFMAFTNIATNVSLASVLLVGGRLIRSGSLTAGALSGFALQSVFVGLGFSGLASVYSDYVKTVDAASRVFTLMDTKATTTSYPNITSPTRPVYVPTPRERYTGIVFTNVCFSYSRRQQQRVLEGLNMSLRPNAISAVVGRSGSGKSTILALLAGLHQVSGGSITINGTDIKEKSREWVRSQVGVVEQTANLLSGTIAENIAYGKSNASMEEIIEAARAADALDFINSFPEKFNTQVGVNGKLLSGGQRARVSLARALIKDPPYLLLDEATAALDPHTEADILRTLTRLSEHKLIVLFTHSESVMRAAHDVLLLQGGTVVKHGTFAELQAEGVLRAAL